MNKEQATARLAEVIQAKVDAALVGIKQELVESRRDRVQWFYAGYDAGLQDTPADANPAGKPFTLEQRKTRAAAAYAIQSNKTNLP